MGGPCASSRLRGAWSVAARGGGRSPFATPPPIPPASELPAPAVMLRLEALVLAESVGNQLELVRPEGDELRAHLSEGLRQVRAGTGSGSVCTVVEVAPWSRIPETRALFVPRDD